MLVDTCKHLTVLEVNVRITSVYVNEAYAILNRELSSESKVYVNRDFSYFC